MKKRSASVIFLLIFALLALCACGQDGSVSEQDVETSPLSGSPAVSAGTDAAGQPFPAPQLSGSPPDARREHLAVNAEKESASTPSIPPETVKPGVLSVATCAVYPPYASIRGGYFSGIDAALSAALADKLGLELSVEDMNFTDLPKALLEGRADLALAGLGRGASGWQVRFTDSYAENMQLVLTRSDSALAASAELSRGGCTVGTVRDSMAELYASWKLEDYGLAHVLRYDSAESALAGLLAGETDALILDYSLAWNFASSNGQLKILNGAFLSEEISGAMSPEREELYEAVNGALRDLIADGTVQRIMERYIF